MANTYFCTYNLTAPGSQFYTVTVVDDLRLTPKENRPVYRDVELEPQEVLAAQPHEAADAFITRFDGLPIDAVVVLTQHLAMYFYVRPDGKWLLDLDNTPVEPLTNTYCRVCGTYERVRYRLQQRRSICDFCVVGMEVKVSREEFEKAFWGDEAEMVPEIVRREFYEEYTLAQGSLEQYIESCRAP